MKSIIKPRLKFQGQEYILVNRDGNRHEGAIATVEEYENFALNQFHLFEDGRILSFGEQVGTKEDIEWLN